MSGISEQRRAELSAQDAHRESLRQRLYGNATPQSGSISRAVSKTFDRLERWARDTQDRPDQLNELRQQRREIEKFANERRVAPRDLDAMLDVYRERVMAAHPSKYVLNPPSPADLAASAERGRIDVIRSTGSQEAAEARIKHANTFVRDLAKASPTFAGVAERLGVAASAEFINAASTYGEPAPAASAPGEAK